MNSDLSLAAMRGWKIFPLAHSSSRFAVSQPLLHDATSDEAKIAHWENQYPECNWAVATGEESGIFAIKFSLDMGLATVRELANVILESRARCRYAAQMSFSYFWNGQRPDRRYAPAA